MPTNSCKPLTVTGCLNHVGMGGNIPSGHGNLVVSSNKVNLGEYTLTSEVGGFFVLHFSNPTVEQQLWSGFIMEL